MEKNHLRLIVSDIDGTLLNSEGCLTDRTDRALGEVHRRGIHTVIATGRAYTALPEQIKSLKSVEYVITSNGTSIFRLSDGKRIYGRDMPESLVRRVYSVFKQYPYPVEVFIEGQAYTTKAYYDCPRAFGISEMSAGYVRRTRKPVLDMAGFIEKEAKHIEGMDIVIDNPEMKNKIRKETEALENIYVTTSEAHYIEVAAKGCSKGAALSYLARKLHVSLSEAAAFGDGENDLEMIKKCGIGIAVGNGCALLKAAADITALSNDEDGVAAFLEHWFQKADGEESKNR